MTQGARNNSPFEGGKGDVFIKLFVFSQTYIFARMAELVDALVSNTSGSNAVPVRSRLRVLKQSERVSDHSRIVFSDLTPLHHPYIIT
jgi:hypothetical protein